MKDTFKGKSIIVGLPKHLDIDQVLIRELKNLGFLTIIEVSFGYKGFVYKSLLQRIKSFFIKNFANRPQYKQTLAFEDVENEFIEKLNCIARADYALLIRPDIYTPKFIDKVIDKSKKTSGYQWDGLKRFPAVRPLVKKFDRFFVFDAKDLKCQGLMPLTNFGVTSYTDKELYDKERQTDAYYLGSFYAERIPILYQIISQLSTLGLEVNYILTSRKPKKSKKHPLITTTETISFEENLKNSYNTQIIIDLVVEGHQGLSFRVFEALMFDKKLITTNKSVALYDFYHRNNIFVLSKSTTTEELNAFINLPKYPISEALKQKYGFENWIKYVLDEGDFETINLPNV